MHKGEYIDKERKDDHSVASRDTRTRESLV